MNESQPTKNTQKPTLSVDALKQEHKENTPTHSTEQVNSMEKKMVSKIRDNIDERGNFKYKLSDLTVGYAAGKNLNEFEAEKEVKGIFQKEYGMDVQNYLDNHRKARGLEVIRINLRVQTSRASVSYDFFSV